MTPERFGRWLTALGLGAGAFALWPQIKPIIEWVLFNLQVVVRVPFVQHWLIATAIGTAFCLALPWWLPHHFTSARSQSSIRILGGAFSFTVALWLNQTRVGFIVAIFCGFSGPMVGMAVIRQLMACKWLPKPMALRPTEAEAKAQLDIATKPDNGG